MVPFEGDPRKVVSPEQTALHVRIGRRVPRFQRVEERHRRLVQRGEANLQRFQPRRDRDELGGGQGRCGATADVEVHQVIRSPMCEAATASDRFSIDAHT